MKNILHFFGLKTKIDSKPIRREMDMFFRNKNWEYQHTITDIIAYEKSTKLFITITTHRPGFLIGRHGHLIDELNQHLKDRLHKEINIHVKESQLWMRLYS